MQELESSTLIGASLHVPAARESGKESQTMMPDSLCRQERLLWWTRSGTLKRRRLRRVAWKTDIKHKEFATAFDGWQMLVGVKSLGRWRTGVWHTVVSSCSLTFPHNQPSCIRSCRPVRQEKG